MATTPQQGIMALPETDEASTPQLSVHESYDAAKQGLAEADPQFAAMYQSEMSKAMPALMALSDNELDILLQLIQYLQENPEEYSKTVQELEADGTLEKGSLPPEYDENFLAVFGAAVLEAQKTNEDTGAAAPAMQPPMQLAKGGIAEAARMVASQGRTGDTMLAHITKDEAALLKKHGGMGTRNPRTGMREYGLVSSLKKAVSSVGSAISGAVKAVGSAVKTVLSSSVGKIAATVALAAFIGPAAFGLSGAAGVAAQMGLASAGITALSGGNLKDIVKSGVTGAVAGYGGAALGPAIAPSLGATGQAALGAGLTSTGLGVVQGKSISDSVKAGLASAAVAGAMSAANSDGISRGTQGTNNAPVDDRSFNKEVLTPQNAGQAGDVMTPTNAGQINVNAQTGQVTGGAPVPLASSNQAFENALANQNPINGLTMDNGLTGVQPPVAQAPAATSADPLGDFIQQNEALRAAANTPVPKPEPTFWDQTKQAYNEYLSPSGRAEAGLQEAKAEALKGYKADLANGVPQELAVQNYKDALNAAKPGVLSNYGPAIGAGLGITALAGGFTPAEQPGMSDETKDVISGKATQDIISANPKNYITQGLPGVTYDAAGNITSSGSWTPRSGSGTTEVAGNYINYTKPAQTAMPNVLPSVAPVAQTAAPAPQTYNFMPRYAAQGGMMETAGAFPANPLTMSNPAMAMHAQQMPMNTPGVPMNMPMGFAYGGSADEASVAANGGAQEMSGPFAGAFNEILPFLKQAVQQKAPARFALDYAAIQQAAQDRAIAAQADANARIAAYNARQRAAGRPVANEAAGIASLAVGGYPRRTGQIDGPGTETSDSIPAMLSDGEFVMTAKAVKGLGGGSRRAGAKKMYALMHRLENNAARG